MCNEIAALPMIDSLLQFANSQVYVALVMCVLIVCLVLSRLRPPLLFLIALMALYLPGTLDTQSMLAAFVNPALITLMLLVLLANTLEKTPYIHSLAELILRGSPRWALARLVFITGTISALASNTAIVAALTGPLQQSKKHIPSRLLIPLSYASILGGMLTLVGTSTNLIVSAFVVSEGLPALHFFDFTAMGACTFLVCGGLIVLISSRLLPANKKEALEPNAQYFIEATILPGSPLIGGTVMSNGIRNLKNLFLVEVIRPLYRISPVSPGTVLRVDDVLVFSGAIEHIEILKQFEGLAIQGESHHSLLKENLLQTIVSHNSELLGKSIVEVNFRALFDAAVIAVCRGHSQIRGGLGKLRLRTGDLLLLAVGEDFNKLTNRSTAFVVVNKPSPRKFLTSKNSLFALVIFIAALAMSIFGFVSLLKALFAALAVYLITKLTTVSEIRRLLPVNLLLVVGSALGIAHVVVSSGLAHTLSDAIIGLFSPFGVYGALIGVYLLTLLLTELITNNASAALACPIAYSLAIDLGVSTMPFFMAVAFAASASFISPYGYQTNLMVFAAGKYRFSDYARLGVPVSLVYSITVLLLLPIFFPFYAG